MPDQVVQAEESCQGRLPLRHWADQLSEQQVTKVTARASPGADHSAGLAPHLLTVSTGASLLLWIQRAVPFWFYSCIFEAVLCFL